MESLNANIAGGIDNARSEATLIVLDPRTMQGASKETDSAYQLIGLPPPVEVARVFFPRSCTAAGQSYNALRQLSVREDSILAEVWEHPYGPLPPSVFYTLDRQLRLQQVGVSDRFRVVHDELRAKGILNHGLEPNEIARLIPVIQRADPNDKLR